jgi:predicted O-methyltransferase YrrM
MVQTLIFVLVTLLFGIHDAEAQKFSRGMRGGNRSGAGAQISIRNPHGFSQAGRFIVSRTPTTFVRRVPASHGLVKVAPIPVFVAPVAPGFHHFGHAFVPAVFPGQSGILIIDVDTTTITGVDPGIGYQDPPIVSPARQLTPERSVAQLAPFDSTPEEVVERLLVLASVKKGDTVYDLGSGDGRVVIAAAKKFGVKAVGFEIDPDLVKLARENVRKQGVEKLVEIRQQDFTSANLSPASVVTLYLSNDGNPAVRPALMHQLKPGARIVSYGFDMGDWAPKIMETYRDRAGASHLLYLW